MENYIVANGTPGNSAPVVGSLALGGRRRRHSKSAKKVSARKIRATLRKLHMRPKSRMVLKGGESMDSSSTEEKSETQSAGRRRRRGRKSRKGLRGMLGF